MGLGQLKRNHVKVKIIENNFFYEQKNCGKKT